MAVSQYPTPFSAAHPSEPDGPGPGGASLCGYNLQRLPDEYLGIVVKTMVDGGAVYGADSTNVLKRWRFSYTGLSSTQAGVLDDHRAEAKDRLLGFVFRDPRTGTSYSDVHYEEFEYPAHEQYNNQTRIVTLVKRPA